jgi:hypothetical protein
MMKIAVFALAICTALSTPAYSIEEPYFDPDGPFRIGEGFGTPATCETIGDWIDKVPDYDGRISMVITGKIVESHWDGALAYLIMCEPGDIQVMCVTYHASEVNGKTVKFAGGYSRVGDQHILLDPCLDYEVESEPSVD